MKEQLVNILEKQLDKLDQPDFDLEAWKSSASAALDKVYGKGNDLSQEVRSLKIDYSSWALRDSNSGYMPKESTKKRGKEIIESAIEEISVFGVPQPLSNLLSEYFSKSDVEKLLSEESGKLEVIKQLNPEAINDLVIKLIEYKK